MTKKADTWMPWYVADYLADTAHLSTEQHGAYCLMLMAAWKRGGSLPKDDAQLAAVCRLSASRWKQHKSILLEFFEDGEEAFTHKRVTLERLKAQEISDKKGKAGADGAAKRWHKQNKEDGKTNGKTNGKPIANAIANASQNDAPSPSPLPVPSELVQGADAPLPPASPAAEPAHYITGDLPAGIPPCPLKQLVGMFVEKVPDLPKPRYELWSQSKGADAMRARWKWLLSPDATREDGNRYATTAAEGVEWFGRFFDAVAESDFLTGRNGAWKNCDLTWLMNRENFMKVVQGNYQRERAAA